MTSKKTGANSPEDRIVGIAPGPDPSNTPIEELVEPIDPDDDVRDRIRESARRLGLPAPDLAV